MTGIEISAKKFLSYQKNERVKKHAIAHYERMIEWAKKQNKSENPEENPCYEKMEKELGEDWYAEYCPYCQEYKNLVNYYCCDCPLQEENPIKPGTESNCCDGLWLDMSRAESWGEWIEKAKKVLQYIKEKG